MELRALLSASSHAQYRGPKLHNINWYIDGEMNHNILLYKDNPLDGSTLMIYDKYFTAVYLANLIYYLCDFMSKHPNNIMYLETVFTVS